MNKLKIIILSTLFLGLSSSAWASLCTNVYYPVCWEDGKTYQNMCFLNEAEVKLQAMWTCSWIKSKNEKEVKKSLEKEEVKNAKITTPEEKMFIKLDNYFSGKDYSISKKIEILNKIEEALTSNKSLSKSNKEFYSNVIAKYRLNFETIILSEEEEKQNKLNQENELKEEVKADSVSIDKKEENINEYKWFNTPGDRLKLFVRYIRDNLWVRPLNWQRITALSIIGKKTEEWITKNYTIYAVTEFYKDKEWKVHEAKTTEWVAVILSTEENGQIELLEYLSPRTGQFYYQDYIKLFPYNLREKLEKNSDFYKDTIDELKEVNRKSAEKYYGLKKD